MGKGICVVAIGGNAILSESNKGTVEEQVENIRIVCCKIVDLVTEGYHVVITHGNGPQVGQALLRHKLACDTVPEGSLNICGAETQGVLGYLIQQSLRNQLKRAGLDRDVATIVTQVLVSEDDKAFQLPTKPIGPFYSQEDAERMARKYNKNVIEDSGRGYRLVVPSPAPVDIIEKTPILSLLRTGAIVIAAGGGGIPVIEKGDGLIGIEAVIDKDFASSVLAKVIGAKFLMLLTGVEKVCINYKKPNETQLDTITISEAEKYLCEGQFPEGSMAPKIRAAVDFIKSGGNKAIITTLSNIGMALQGKTGTAIIN
jgi:carbamate kinase